MQLGLPIGLRDDASFDNFIPGENTVALEHLKSLFANEQSEGSVYLWGAKAAGKTHLLQALCHQATAANQSIVYLPMQHWQEMDVAILEGFEQYQMVCIDDIDAIAGQILWEQELFHLYNRILERKVQLVVSASTSLQESAITLPDLKSRLGWGPVFHVRELSEEGKIQALQQSAQRRGFDLPDNVAQYLLRRYSRDMNSLFTLLNELDKASLAAQRRLTVPFVKQWLEVNRIGEGSEE